MCKLRHNSLEFSTISKSGTLMRILSISLVATGFGSRSFLVNLLTPHTRRTFLSPSMKRTSAAASSSSATSPDRKGSSWWNRLETLSKYEATKPHHSWVSSKIFCKESNDFIRDFFSSSSTTASSSSSSSSSEDPFICV